MIAHTAVRPTNPLRHNWQMPCAAGCGRPVGMKDGHVGNALPGSAATVAHYHPECCPLCPQDASGATT